MLLSDGVVLEEGQIILEDTPVEARTEGARVGHIDFTIDGEEVWTERHPPYDIYGGSGKRRTSQHFSSGTHAFGATVHFRDGTTATTTLDLTVGTPTPESTPEPDPTPTEAAAPTFHVDGRELNDGDTLDQQDNLAVTIDPGTTIDKVELSIGGEVVSVEGLAPYEYWGGPWKRGADDTYPAATNTYSATVHFRDGTTATTTLDLTVRTPTPEPTPEPDPTPTEAAAPTFHVDGRELNDGDTLDQQDNLAVTIDPGTTIDKVELSIGGEVVSVEGLAPYEYWGGPWKRGADDTYPDGANTYSATVHFRDGTTATTTLDLTVGTPTPEATPEPPIDSENAADVVVRPGDDLRQAILEAGPGGIVELAPGHYGDVLLDASSADDGWSEPVTVRAAEPADWERAWKIIATESYRYDANGNIAASTFDGVWSSSFGDFETHVGPLRMVGFGFAGTVKVRDVHVDFDRAVSASSQNRWYPRSDFNMTRSVLAWPGAVTSGDRLQISDGGTSAAGRTVLLDQVMIGNIWRTTGSTSHTDALQTLTDARVVIRRSALLASTNRVQLSVIGEGSSIEDTYIESSMDAQRRGYHLPSAADTKSTGGALMADGNAPSLRRVLVNGSVSERSQARFDVSESRVRYYGGDGISRHWKNSVIQEGNTGSLPDGNGNTTGSVDPDRPATPLG